MPVPNPNRARVPVPNPIKLLLLPFNPPFSLQCFPYGPDTGTRALLGQQLATKALMVLRLADVMRLQPQRLPVLPTAPLCACAHASVLVACKACHYE